MRKVVNLNLNDEAAPRISTSANKQSTLAGCAGSTEQAIYMRKEAESANSQANTTPELNIHLKAIENTRERND